MLLFYLGAADSCSRASDWISATLAVVLFVVAILVLVVVSKS